MKLKLSRDVKKTTALLYKQKTVWKFGSFLAKKLILFFNFGLFFTKNPLFESDHVWQRHCDVIRWPIFMILVSMERRDDSLYHGTKQ